MLRRPHGWLSSSHSDRWRTQVQFLHGRGWAGPNYGWARRHRLGASGAIDAGDRENNYMATMDVRVLAMIGGVVVPVADTCWFAGEADARWLHIPWDGGDDSCSGSLHFSISMDIDVGAMPSTFKSLTLSWEERNAGGDPVAEPDEYGAKLTLLDGLRGLRHFYDRPKAWSDTFRPIDVLTSDDEHDGERHELASDFVRKKGPSLDRPDGGEVDFTRRRPRPGARLA